MNSQQTVAGAIVLVRTRGTVSRESCDYARDKVRVVIERLGQPVLAARVKLTQEAGHAVVRSALAQAVVDLGGRRVRAQVAARTMHEAVDLLQERLAARLARARHYHDVRGHQAPAGPLTLPVAPSAEHRPQRREVPAAERRIVRLKSYGLPRCSPREAVYEMEAMDYDFHLFTDALTGRDSVVYRDQLTGGHRSSAAGRPGVGTWPAGTDPVPSEVPVPVLTVENATLRLELTGLPFVFFADPATQRGRVLYHRWDGHYGLVAPSL